MNPTYVHVLIIDDEHGQTYTHVFQSEKGAEDALYQFAVTNWKNEWEKEPFPNNATKEDAISYFFRDSERYFYQLSKVELKP